MNSSAVDARIVIATEKLLNDGAVIYSEKRCGRFVVRITLNELYIGCGDTFAEAFNAAYSKTPGRVAVAA